MTDAAYQSRLEQACAALAGIEQHRAAPLAQSTSFGIGGPADLLVVARQEDEVVRALRVAEEHQLPLLVLGGGSNVLIGDAGVRGVTLTLAGALGGLTVQPGGAGIEVGAACTFARLTHAALDLGWPPAAGWYGTPGQVGGALVMNAGSAHGEIGAVVVEVRLATSAGLCSRDRDACGFGYRASAFPARSVLTSAVLQCDSRKSKEVEVLKAMAQELLSRRHSAQPKLKSAGSVFKNPPGDFAGRLIEAAGLKGYAVGGAQVSLLHANFIVNTGGATARDVVAVAEHARAVVKAQSGVELEWEVRRVGEHL